MPGDHVPKAEIARDKALSKHILPSSGTMIGVCATVIGLVKVMEPDIGPSRVDEYAALASIFFLAGAVASYASMRSAARPHTAARYEAVADQCFLGGLVAVTLIILLFAYEVI
jgi:flagellar motor component MotA